MKNFFAGVAITTVLWLTCLGLMYVDHQRQRMELHQELIQENYNLRNEIVKITKISKAKAHVLVSGRRG
jgi:uncharacterized membrane protein (Fun14 family)